MRSGDQARIAAPAEVLACLADELDHAVGLCDRLDGLLAKGVGIAGLPADLQTLDLLTQHLSALAGFARALSVQSRPGGLDLTPALRTIPLTDLAHRLTPGASAPVAPAQSGDLDLF